jgi:murein DD-endopeptidase MepM/ murein hydrolase activator NlpD
VGYVGLTGNVRGAHLHVSFIVADEVGYIYDEKTGNLLVNEIIDRSKNPFN